MTFLAGCLYRRRMSSRASLVVTPFTACAHGPPLSCAAHDAAGLLSLAAAAALGTPNQRYPCPLLRSRHRPCKNTLMCMCVA